MYIEKAELTGQEENLAKLLGVNEKSVNWNRINNRELMKVGRG